ncbi:oxygen-insensitive NAD(P)H nitroreductase [Vibrio sp. La 4.2.2]|uniref:oxygen-insensitive NAD(P)H nitroreductase n=1 Tax=Vibrio sp. La 4.2.2 TaxID=2998830 RepID=UPI0022CE18BF|nr:oxygen-insensitive NAD(P)H nitroreductase [Vibrio sp. La 4.2.2]MDA0109950.1 oxygen-insensitive NAD(P)H nitroreductase [Vibrio sp. La 4.2.2]
MNIADNAKNRYSTKVFDPSFKLSSQQVDAIKTLLRFSPSSVNSQPWHFIIASTDEAKQRVATATQGRYSFNAPKVLNASHVIVFCTRTEIDDNYLQLLLENEEKDGRFATPDAKLGQQNGRHYFVDMHRSDLKDAQHWMEKQVYLNVGTLLLGASTLGIDAVPIEGFDSTVLDKEFNLAAQGYRSSVIVPLGKHSEQDFNAKLPKSRHSSDYLFSEC